MTDLFACLRSHFAESPWGMTANGRHFLKRSSFKLRPRLTRPRSQRPGNKHVTAISVCIPLTAHVGDFDWLLWCAPSCGNKQKSHISVQHEMPQACSFFSPHWEAFDGKKHDPRGFWLRHCDGHSCTRSRSLWKLDQGCKWGVPLKLSSNMVFETGKIIAVISVSRTSDFSVCLCGYGNERKLVWILRESERQ